MSTFWKRENMNILFRLVSGDVCVWCVWVVCVVYVCVCDGVCGGVCVVYVCV